MSWEKRPQLTKSFSFYMRNHLSRNYVLRHCRRLENVSAGFLRLCTKKFERNFRIFAGPKDAAASRNNVHGAVNKCHLRDIAFGNVDPRTRGRDVRRQTCFHRTLSLASRLRWSASKRSVDVDNRLRRKQPTVGTELSFSSLRTYCTVCRGLQNVRNH